MRGNKSVNWSSLSEVKSLSGQINIDLSQTLVGNFWKMTFDLRRLSLDNGLWLVQCQAIIWIHESELTNHKSFDLHAICLFTYGICYELMNSIRRQLQQQCSLLGWTIVVTTSLSHAAGGIGPIPNKF